MDLQLAGATAAVTGGTRGMGLAIARCLAEEGAKVAVFARGGEDLAAAETSLRSAGSPQALGLRVDVTDTAAVTRAFATLEAQWGTLNVLVNTVGPGAGRFEQLSDADWHETFDVGTLSAVRCIRAALPLLRRAPWARIVNLSAHSTQRQSPMLVAYTAAKAALTSVTKNLSKSLAPEGILVNTVSPGTIVTASFTRALRSQLEAEGLDASDPHDVMTWIDRVFHQPADIGRAGLPEEVGAVVAFLASPRNGYVTGADINVDGGSDFR